ncbi:MAG: beta-glucosidase [Lachnotalea sp.]
MINNTIETEIEIENILAQLTLDEKIGMIHGNGLFRTEGIKRLGIPPLKMSDGPMGVRSEFENASWNNIGNSDDFVTYLPCNSALASTWNPELAYQLGKVLGEEARGRGKDVILAPGVNIMRSPACGRNFEYMSEDPYLTAKTAVPIIKGIQEADVASCVKHFAVNNQETERLWVDVEIEERTLREIYLPAFKEAVEVGNSYSLMGAYNLLYGEHCCQSKFLLNGILKNEWGYDGCVISDWGAVHDTKAAAESGLDIEMSVTSNFDDYFMAEPLKKAIQNGEIEESLLDEKVRNILRLMKRLNMLGEKRCKGSYNTSEHRDAALNIARESVILLKNEENRLPLCGEKIKKLLVIGDNAEKIHSCGGGSAEIKALYEISPLMGLKKILGGNTEITYVRGYYVEPKKEDSDANWQENSLEDIVYTKLAENMEEDTNVKRQQYLEEAVTLAKEADEVIIIGGLNHDYDSEGLDRIDMKLPYDQDTLIEEVLKVKKNTVVVMMAGSPVEMGKWINDAKAVVWSWYAGMEGGTALAEVLLGEVNPSGKLPTTFPKELSDCPAYLIGEFPGGKTVAYKEGIFVGYRYYDTYHIDPEFCFGHGLSYASFDYQNLCVSVSETEDVIITATLEVKNISKVAGAEIIQLYIAGKNSSVERPFQELKQYQKVTLEPEETKKITFILNRTAFGYYDIQSKQFKSEVGEYEIHIGSSSKDIRLENLIELNKNYFYK